MLPASELSMGRTALSANPDSTACRQKYINISSQNLLDKTSYADWDTGLNKQGMEPVVMSQSHHTALSHILDMLSKLHPHYMPLEVPVSANWLVSKGYGDINILFWKKDLSIIPDKPREPLIHRLKKKKKCQLLLMALQLTKLHNCDKMLIKYQRELHHLPAITSIKT